MVKLLADPETYRTQFERGCAASPEYVVRLEGGDVPVDAWVCLECSQITVTVGAKMKARGGFDRVAGELRKRMREVVGESQGEGGTPWILDDGDFPLEEDALPADELPALQGMNPGVRLLTRNAPLAPGEGRLRLRIDPEGTHVFVRLGKETTEAERARVESLVRGLVFTPARRNGLPVSAWVEIAYTPQR
ncbi:MAG TPA: hypothetical protein VLA89_18505 [Gemmatimonadales bacterium]|nr:hypothetical protein [Gemmatimonadales bacterium]